MIMIIIIVMMVTYFSKDRDTLADIGPHKPHSDQSEPEVLGGWCVGRIVTVHKKL
jgi:hypothetical protein